MIPSRRERRRPAARSRDGLLALLREYETYLLEERGFQLATLAGYRGVARAFLSCRRGGIALERLAAADVTSFILRESRSCSIGTTQFKGTVLRSLLRFLHVRGDLPADLSGAVPPAVKWRLVGLPKALSPKQVRSLLGGCDRHTKMGLRDYTVLLLMVRLGLRASEVAALTLDDIRWRAGELVLQAGKGGREDRLPLTHDVGQSLASYLKRGRPGSSESRMVFASVLAPHGALSRGRIKEIVRAAGRRVGLVPLGAHRLRHTAATSMLRGGASLSEIAQVLRHRHVDTTAIYAKVDHARLRTLCRPWPGRMR